MPRSVCYDGRMSQTNEEIASQALEAIQAALRIVDLWLPYGEVTEEHEEEAKALCAMKQQFENVVENARAEGLIKNEGIWWCNSHNRVATHLDKKGRHCCDPNLGGICIPCRSVLLPVKIVNEFLLVSRNIRLEANND